MKYEYKEEICFRMGLTQVLKLSLVCLQNSENVIHLAFWAELSSNVGAQNFPEALH